MLPDFTWQCLDSKDEQIGWNRAALSDPSFRLKPGRDTAINYYSGSYVIVKRFYIANKIWTEIKGFQAW